jgi:hypothetical protein
MRLKWNVLTPSYLSKSALPDDHEVEFESFSDSLTVDLIRQAGETNVTIWLGTEIKNILLVQIQ